MAPEPVGIETVDARVHFADGALFLGRVLVFHDPRNGAVLLADDASVVKEVFVDAGVIRDDDGAERDGLLALLVVVKDGSDGISRDEGLVTGEHDDVFDITAVTQDGCGTSDSVSGTELFLLFHTDYPVFEILLYGMTLESDDDDRFGFRYRSFGRFHDILDDRLALDSYHRLGYVRHVHPGPFPSCHHDHLVHTESHNEIIEFFQRRKPSVMFRISCP